MPELTVHDVPQEELDALASRAARHGRDVETELRHLIHEAAAEEILITGLQRVTDAVEELKHAESHDAPPAAPRRRYHAHEPTPRSRK